MLLCPTNQVHCFVRGFLKAQMSDSALLLQSHVQDFTLHSKCLMLTAMSMWTKRSFSSTDAPHGCKYGPWLRVKLKKIIGKSKMKAPKESTEKPVEEGEGVNTTLQTYFFGKKGENKLQYQQFCRFMEDLQAEVQEMEFLQFSRGMDTMRREDFAEWLLHYTNEEDNEVYWENMRKKIPAGQSITFAEFKAFCLFTNNLEDFAFSMKLVTGANRPVQMAQFKRAVRIATGHDLSESVLDTVFKLFDMDGDNCLSHKEFMGVMTDRVLRGLKVQHQNGFSGYWKCVKKETMKAAREALGDNGCPF